VIVEKVNEYWVVGRIGQMGVEFPRTIVCPDVKAGDVLAESKDEPGYFVVDGMTQVSKPTPMHNKRIPIAPDIWYTLIKAIH
jgi:hypothetical protein